MHKNNRIGKIGEDISIKYLLSKNYNIRERNYFTPYGEVDIIAEKNSIYFFIEVKTRTSKIYGSGLEAITKRKIEKIKKTSEIYITNQGWDGNYKILCISILYYKKDDFFIDVLEYES